MRTVLFYEPDHNGHHYSYLARMLPGFVDLDVEIMLVTTPEGVSSEQYDFYLKPLERHFRLVTDCKPPAKSPLKIAWRRVSEIKRFQKKYNADHVFVAYADGVWQVFAGQSYLPWVSSRKSYSMEGILYRGDFTYPGVVRRSSKIKRLLFRRLIKRQIFDRLLIDDDHLYDFAEKTKSADGSCGTRIDLAVNPVEFFDIEPAEARRGLGFDSQSRIISLSGMIDRRKGAHLLIEAFVSAIEQGLSDAVLVLAGPHRDDIQSILKKSENQVHVESGRIVSIDRLLNERDMYSVAAASDVVAAPYPNHSGRSSIVIWAAAAGKPVLGTARGCIGFVINRERLGVVCDVTNLPLFAEQIAGVFDQPWSQADIERSKAYAALHTIENYRILNSEFVREAVVHR